MKKSIMAIVLALVSSQAAAEIATVTKVVPFYSNRTISVPQQVCQEQQVPVYGQVQKKGGASATDVLTGMIIGGVIGHQIDHKNGAAAGGVLGGMVAADKAQNNTQQVITGYRVVQNCTTQYSKQTENVLTSYNVFYEVDNSGIVGRGIINAGGTIPQVGDKINVTVTTRISN